MADQFVTTRRQRVARDPNSNTRPMAYALALLVLLQLTTTLCIATLVGVYVVDSVFSTLLSYQALQSVATTHSAVERQPIPPPTEAVEPPTAEPTLPPTEPPTAPPEIIPPAEPPTATPEFIAPTEPPTVTPAFPPPTELVSPLPTPPNAYGPNFTVIEMDGYQFASECPCDQGDLLNCENFDNGPNPPGYGAQACFLRCLQLVGLDIHSLDPDNDTRACEWNG